MSTITLKAGISLAFFAFCLLFSATDLNAQTRDGRTKKPTDPAVIQQNQTKRAQLAAAKLDRIAARQQALADKKAEVKANLNINKRPKSEFGLKGENLQKSGRKANKEPKPNAKPLDKERMEKIKAKMIKARKRN